MVVSGAGEEAREHMGDCAFQGNAAEGVVNSAEGNESVSKPSLRMDISVQSFVDEKLEEVPALFVKPVQGLAVTADSVGEEVPVIDMAAVDAAEQIVRASTEWGVFQAFNHGISKELVERAANLSARYFSMPKDDVVTDKMVFSPRDGTRDWTDCLLHFVVPSREDPQPRTKWPQDYRETLTEFGEQSLNLVRRVLRNALSPGLGLHPDRLLEAAGGELLVVVRVNYYPPCPQPERVLGLTHHTDHGMPTILVQNEVPGLQVYKSGQWITVKPMKDSVIIVLGNMLEILSNGTYKSVVHRAIVNEHAVRTSLAVFHDLRSEVFVEPLPELLDEDHPAIYQGVEYGTSLNEYRKFGLDGRSWLDTVLLHQHQNLNTSV